MFSAKSTWRNTVALALLLCLLMAAHFCCLAVLTACGRKPTPKMAESTEDTRPTESIAQVGNVPAAFEKVVEEDRFRNVDVFADRIMRVESFQTNDEQTWLHRITMMDLYGEIIAQYEMETNAAYNVTAETPTEDGGFIFACGFNGSYIPGWDQIETGYHSRIIKCDRNGKPVFETWLDSVEISALTTCIEKDGCYYFFGALRAPEMILAHGGTDIHILAVDGEGNVVKERFIGGSSFDRVDHVGETAGGFVLEVVSQSDDGDFAGSDAGYHEVYWRVVINDDLEIMDKEIVPERFGIRSRVGVKDGKPVYSDDEMFADFDAGGVCTYIDYGDTYLIVSYRVTGQCEHQPPYISSIWYYWETVYSMYDKSGTLVFRASVDSSPDYSRYEKDDYLP